MKNKKIVNRVLVTGGSGLLGMHMKKIRPDFFYLSSSDCDLTKRNEIDRVFKEIKPNIIVHCAARVGGILDNIKYPVEYFEENILINTNILSKSHEFNIKNLIGILSSCAYPDVSIKYPLNESQLFDGPPTETNFSYGYAKRCMAVLIDAYIKQYKKEWCYLIPCNLYGEYDKFDLNKSHFVTSLVRKIYEADSKVELFGTGKPLRQFMHAEDLSRAIFLLIENGVYNNFNIATDEIFTIREIAEIGIKSCNKDFLELSFDNSKPDGQFRKDIDSFKFLNVFKDFNFTSLENGIKKVYDSFSRRYN
jgi:GDP-L-fucose synthase